MPRPTPAEFSRPLATAGLGTRGTVAIDIAPDPTEAAALARLFGIGGVRRMRLKGQLRPIDAGALVFEGMLGATVTQACVVTLAPVRTRIDVPVRRVFVPDGARPADPILAEAAAEEEVEVLGAAIDLGQLATEALSLALPDYPRAPGATLPAAARDAAWTEADRPRPFAALAALKQPGDTKT